jgi:hypothetical protein
VHDAYLFLFLALTSRWWAPPLFAVLADIWVTARGSGEAKPTSGMTSLSLARIEVAPSATRTERARATDAGPVWSRRRLQNPAWETGRRVRNDSDRPRLGRRTNGLADRSLKRPRWQGGFGRKGL